MLPTLNQQNQLICPLCESTLSTSGNSLLCEKNHCFDYAKEGYINLLPPQHKKTKEPGDNKKMIHCRQDFLKKDYYAFLIPELSKTISEFSQQPATFLDSGCGEGYFTDKLKIQHENIAFYGMDISKIAVRLAAKRNKKIHWFVASSNNIPIENNSLDIVLKINAPLNFEKLKSKMTEKGIVISVSPGKNHLAKLRETMYLKPQSHKQEATPDAYTLLHQREVETHISISNRQDIDNLFKMTPYYWNASQAAKDKVEKLTKLDTTASFNINVFQLAEPFTAPLTTKQEQLD